MTNPFEEITLCPVVGEYMDQNDNNLDFDWFEQHKETCEHCQRIQRLINEYMKPEGEK
jgi:hypothetical protein